MSIDPRYLEPPDLLAAEATCPECDVVLDSADGHCPRCGLTPDEDAIRDAEETRNEPPEWH